MNKIFNNILFRRILVIFVVGLVSRSVVNSFFDINVFKDYTTCISLIYYTFMACFIGFLGELPSISFNVFNIKLIRSAIITLLGDVPYFGAKIPSDMFTSNVDYKVEGLAKNSLYFSQDNTAGRYVRRPSAGIIGLYANNSSVGGNVKDNITPSLGDKLRCKILWLTWMKYTDNYTSYGEYKASFDPTRKVSIVEEIKKNREIKRNK